jgi:hypothetical protein
MAMATHEKFQTATSDNDKKTQKIFVIKQREEKLPKILFIILTKQ